MPKSSSEWGAGMVGRGSGVVRSMSLEQLTVGIGKGEGELVDNFAVLISVWCGHGMGTSEAGREKCCE